MTITGIILRLVAWLTSLMGFFGFLLLVPFLIVGIILLVKASNESDKTKRESRKKKGIIFIILPFAMIIASWILGAIIGAIMVSTGVHPY